MFDDKRVVIPTQGDLDILVWSWGSESDTEEASTARNQTRLNSYSDVVKPIPTQEERTHATAKTN